MLLCLPALPPPQASTFELTIRALGGLLSAHALTSEHLYLTRATELGYRLLRAFETPVPIQGLQPLRSHALAH